MAFDLEEQEQLDEFKAWWNKNGKLVTSIIIVGLLAYAGWQGYQFWMNKKSTEASNLYQALVTTDIKNLSEIKSQADKLTSQYSSTPYAGRAAVFAASASYTAKDTAGSKNQLEWAIKNAKESNVQAIASLQLAAILYENKDYEGAKRILSEIKDDGYAGLKDNMLGDVLLAQGKKDEAKKSFESALKGLDQQGKFYLLTKQKLDALGA
jgi:predicted negative regulator of RcsB-dependent stress response